MAARSFFRWWYLLFLLPVILYVGARAYVSYRIDQAIDRANTGGNTLTVAEYSFGFFPPAVSTCGLALDQTRPGLSAKATLQCAELHGLDLLSLFGDDPITVDRLTLTGLKGTLTRTEKTATDTARGPGFRLRLLELQSPSFTYEDLPGQQRASVTELDLSVAGLSLPLQPAELHEIELAASEARFSRQRDSLSVQVQRITYRPDRTAVHLQAIVLTRGAQTDLHAEDVLLAGLPRSVAPGSFHLERLRIGQLGGGAQVGTTSRRATPAQAKADGQLTVTLGAIELPNVDIQLAEGFGRAQLAGALQLHDLTVGDSLSLGELIMDGKELSYAATNGARVTAQGAELRHRQLAATLGDRTQLHQLGPTQLTIDHLSVGTPGGQTVDFTPLTYASETGELGGEQVRIRGERLSGELAALTVTGIDREAVLNDRPLTAERAKVRGAAIHFRNPDGGSYDLQAPELTLHALSLQEGLTVDRAQLANGTLRRRGSTGREDLRVTGVYIDQYGIRTPVRPAQLGESKLRARQASFFGEALPVDHYVHGIRYGSRVGRLTVDSVRRSNRLGLAEFFARPVAKSYLQFGLDSVRVTGVNHPALVRGERVDIDSLLVADFRLSVVEDMNVELPGPPKQKKMPIEALRELGTRIVIPAARLTSTDIAYGVIDTSMTPKQIHFTQGTIRLHGLDTDSSATDTVYATVEATFERTTPLRAVFALARDGGGRNYAIRGELGSYDLSRINPLFEVAADAYIETGTIDRMTYAGRMQDEIVTGELSLLYHDLSVDLVGSGAWFKNLLSGLVLKEHNREGEDFRQGRMYHEHDGTKSFFNAYWRGLVSGMKSSALSDIALPGELD